MGDTSGGYDFLSFWDDDSKASFRGGGSRAYSPSFGGGDGTQGAQQAGKSMGIEAAIDTAKELAVPVAWIVREIVGLAKGARKKTEAKRLTADVSGLKEDVAAIKEATAPKSTRQAKAAQSKLDRADDIARALKHKNAPALSTLGGKAVGKKASGEALRKVAGQVAGKGALVTRILELPALFLMGGPGLGSGDEWAGVSRDSDEWRFSPQAREESEKNMKEVLARFNK